jgi:hypothetical protein
MDDVSRARDALNHIDAGIARDEWVRAGMAAKSAGLSFDDFHHWSASAGNYAGENECRAVWKSFDDSGAVTPATLYGMAFAQGWEDPSRAKISRPSLPCRAKTNASKARKTGRKFKCWCCLGTVHTCDTCRAIHSSQAREAGRIASLSGQRIAANHPWPECCRLSGSAMLER